MELLSLGLDDVCHHVVTFGMDIYPQVEIPNERTRLNMFYEEVRHRWDKLFDRLVASDTEFRISKEFRKRPELAGRSYPVDTFVLTPRGPVFVFPLVLPDPVGQTGLEDTYLEDFAELRSLFFRAVPERAVMRVGLIRELIFDTGQTPCQQLLTDRASFANADLVGGQLLFKYRDTKFNHNILIEPGSWRRTTQLQVGATMNEPAGCGVRVRFDVNNTSVQKPLDESEIQGVLDRATSLWPDDVLGFLRKLQGRNRP